MKYGLTYLTVVIAVVASLFLLPSQEGLAQSSGFTKPVLRAVLHEPYVGVGFAISLDGENWNVTSVYARSPAEAAGISVGDIIESANGNVLTGKPIEEVTPLISGPAGTVVVLMIRRTGIAEAITVSTTLRTVEPDQIDLEWEEVQGAVHYEMWQWTSGTGWTPFDVDGETKLTETSYYLWGLEAGVAYYFTVRAVDAEGQVSEWSEYASATWTPTESEVVPTATATVTATSTPEPTGTAALTATPTPVPSQPTPSPTPTESVQQCPIVRSIGYGQYFSTAQLQPASLAAFATRFGEAPDDPHVYWANYLPGFFGGAGGVEIGYLESLSNDGFVMIWERWRGCEYMGTVLQVTDGEGIPIDE